MCVGGWVTRAGSAEGTGQREPRGESSRPEPPAYGVTRVNLRLPASREPVIVGTGPHVRQPMDATETRRERSGFARQMQDDARRPPLVFRVAGQTGDLRSNAGSSQEVHQPPALGRSRHNS